MNPSVWRDHTRTKRCLARHVARLAMTRAVYFRPPESFKYLLRPLFRRKVRRLEVVDDHDAPMIWRAHAWRPWTAKRSVARTSAAVTRPCVVTKRLSTGIKKDETLIRSPVPNTSTITLTGMLPSPSLPWSMYSGSVKRWWTMTIILIIIIANTITTLTTYNIHRHHTHKCIIPHLTGSSVFTCATPGPVASPRNPTRIATSTSRSGATILIPVAKSCSTRTTCWRTTPKTSYWPSTSSVFLTESSASTILLQSTLPVSSLFLS